MTSRLTLVRPLEVLEHEHRRPVDGLDGSARRSRGRGSAAIRACRRPCRHGSRAAPRRATRSARPRASCGRGRGSMPAAPGGPAARGRRTPTRNPAASAFPIDGALEPGLADARLPREQQHVAAATRGLGDAAIRELEEVVAPDEERADEGSDLAHRRECRAAGPVGHRSIDGSAPRGSFRGAPPSGTLAPCVLD